MAAPALSQRTRHTVRTLIQILIAVAAAIPDVVEKVPLGATGAQVVVVAGLVTHYFHLVESLPFFPAWLKLDEAKPKGATP